MNEFFNETISYHELINGDLAPNAVDTSNIAEYLNCEGIYCQEMIIAKYDKDNFEFIEEIRVSSAHPLAESYFNAEEPHSSKEVQDILKSKILQHLNIQTVKLENKFIYISENSVQLVGMIIDADWDEVEKDRLKYCYINRLLQEMEKKHIGIIKQINITQSENQLKSSIIKIQRDLHGNLNEIINEFDLKSSDLDLKIKKVYTDKDCVILVYKSMLEILDYITFLQILKIIINLMFLVGLKKLKVLRKIGKKLKNYLISLFRIIDLCLMLIECLFLKNIYKLILKNGFMMIFLLEKIMP